MRVETITVPARPPRVGALPAPSFAIHNVSQSLAATSHPPSLFASPLIRMNSAPPGPPAPPTVLDAATLDRLRELDPQGRHGVLQRVLSAYDAALVRYLAQLRAQPPVSPQALGTLAHTLKSSSASVGALELARACEALEYRVRQGAAAQTHDVAELMALIESALVAVRTILRG